MFNRIILVTCLALLLASSSWAAIQPGTYTLSPMFGGHVFDDDQNLDDGTVWSLGLGFNLTERAALEAVFSQTKADGETAATSDVDVRTYRLDALYHFMPQQNLVPYFAVGFGGIVTDPDNGRNQEHLLANVGGGIKYFFNDNVALRADVRYLLDFPQPESNLLYSAGLLFQFGTPDQIPEEVTMETPVETPVSMVAPEPPAAVPSDSDNDGVTDELDQCPATPAAAKVNAIGCPLDSDADGIADYRDQCPNTAPGVSVDANGCPSKLSLQINFGLDSDIISPAYDPEISKAAECIANYPGNIVYIDGHTDNLGPAAYNQKLSVRRATAVMNRLVEKFNIPASRMTSRGFGESMPVADNSNDEGLFLNRRVEVACGATE